ncbi:MAG: methyl-accepting chemotaxis protein [Rhodospirillales bacterium]|nr:methyl-accepting chemotaxis protein [Rhodospirillales bacterium]
MAENNSAGRSSIGPDDIAQERTFLGGLRLGTRLTIFIMLGVVSAAVVAGLLYLADMRSTEALARLGAAIKVSTAIREIEAAAAASRGDAREFLATKNVKLAESYDRHAETLSRNLKFLLDEPAAADTQKTVSTLNDGTTQHATHFQNAVKITALLGIGENAGMIGNADVSGAKLEAGVARTTHVALISGVAKLRRLEMSLSAGIGGLSEALVRNETSGWVRILKASTINAQAKDALQQLSTDYVTDLTQMARTYEFLSRETQRIADVDAYIAPNLQTLTTFAANMIATAERHAKATQLYLRQMLGGGIGAALFVFILIGAALMRSVTNPISRITSAANRIAHGQQMVAVPATGNYDETGELANTLLFFRENILQADHLRSELEERLRKSEATGNLPPVSEVQMPAPAEPEAEIEQDAEDQPTVTALVTTETTALADTQISAISKQLEETSHNASLAAREAECSETMVNGMSDAIDKIDEIENLMSSISDQMSLLAVQTQLSGGDGLEEGENLILLAEKRSGDAPGRGTGQAIGDRIETIQSGTKRAIKAIRQIGETLGSINEIALSFAAATSSDALNAATVLLQQSEELRGKLDDLLGKIRLEGRPSTTYPDQSSKSE